MYLKQIEIRGFKSFADKTLLKLQPGMTAVVGPNGCGKSNIVDAIRWVLGEQSAKALRGASMQDVIFEGTDKRKALPIAEVVLTFTDCEEQLGTAFNEVSISRKVTRDGSSDYYINSKVVRLKDIQRLFANTGVGRVSYSFMLQGQIDQILSTNASERRTIFEEAAGITLYKSQRKEALNKLALVDGNLARITDVIDEVSRQIKSLKRQASKALRYRRLDHRSKHLDLAISAHKYSEFKSLIIESTESSSELSNKIKEYSESLSFMESGIIEKKNQRQKATDEVQQKHQKIYELLTNKENALNQVKVLKTRIEDSLELIENYKKDIDALEEEVKKNSDQAESQAKNKEEQLILMGDSDLIHQNQESEFQDSQLILQKIEEKLLINRNQTNDIENKINRMRSNVTSLELESKTYQVKHSTLTDKIVTSKQELTLFHDSLKDIDLHFHNQTEKHQNIERDLNKQREDEINKLKQFRILQEDYQKADRSIAKKTAQLHVLQNLQAKFEGFAEGAKSILNGKVHNLADGNSVKIISKSIQVPKTYTLALQTLLGMAVDAIYVGDSKKSLNIIDELSEKKLGRVCLQIESKGTPSKIEINLPKTIKKANSVISVVNPDLKYMISKYLDSCYFVDSMKDFIEFWDNNPDFKFIMVASKKGELLDCRGLIYGGQEKDEKAAGVLERASEISLLESDLEEELKQLKYIREQYEVLEVNRNKSSALVEQLRENLADSNKSLASLNADLRSQKEKISKLDDFIEQNKTEREELEKSHSLLLQESKQSKIDLEEAEETYSSLRRDRESIEQEISQRRSDLEGKRDKLIGVRVDLARKKQLILSADESIKRVETNRNFLESKVNSKKQDINSIEIQINEFKKAAEVSKVDAENHEINHNALLESLQAEKKELFDLDTSINLLDEKVACKRNELKDLEKELNQKEVVLAEHKTKLEFLESRVESEHQKNISEVNWKIEYWESSKDLNIKFPIEELEDISQISTTNTNSTEMPSEEDLSEMEKIDWSKTEEEVKELKGLISNMGPVNIDSIGEYTDLKERYDFLKTQSEDLWNSKNALVKSIDEINSKSLEMFKDTFDKIKDNYIYTYEKLSGGGKADLALIDSNDPLESGIDIIARPPGTRLKNVTLLSGGQRTMAAVALLFAIYLVKPSPFCVLDEIDAALDDANIGRFCETLRDFTKNSQFLIITHNKRTISNADTVFGVTMPERGISSLISMRFNKNKDNQLVSIN